MNRTWFSRLNRRHLLDWIPDRIFILMEYRAMMGKKLNLRNPQTFNEKIQWLKLHDRKPIYTTMVDKYAAKAYVASIIGDQYIIPTLGVWDSPDDIDFDSLPNQFVLKVTHDSGGLVICRDKSTLNIEEAKNKLRNSLNTNYYKVHREWPYRDVPKRIIAEQYMEDSATSELRDYKFFCMNGKAQLLYISKGLEHHSTAEISFYSLDGVELPFGRNDYGPLHNAIIPINFDEMKSIANKLANEINSPFVRVDLYSINKHVYFSEITMTPCAGMLPFAPEHADMSLGKMIRL